MPRELNVIQTPTSGGSDACTYMWACAICDENESCQKDKEGHSRWLVAKRMERIEYKVLIMSNKGGVGKSTCTTNIAVSLALKGWHVGICDMDIHGPNIPKMVGAEGQKLKISRSGGIIPFQAYNLKIASMSFLLQNPADPIIWRDAYKYEFINQLLGLSVWAVVAGGFGLVGSQAAALSGLKLPEVPLHLLLFFVLFFLLGFFLYGALYISAVGAAVNSQQEAQSLVFPVILPLVVGVMFFPVVLGSPDSSLSVAMSLVPFWTPLLMFLRLTVVTPPAWQVALGLALTLLSIAGLTWVAARIYRVGILMYGKRPTFPEILRCVRHR